MVSTKTFVYFAPDEKEKLENVPLKLTNTFVTASSDNHWEELKISVKSIQKHFPNSTIIFYDLGLSPDQREEFSSLGNISYRRFNFEKYPKYVSNLKEYRWKMLIMAEMLREYPSFWWCDSSIVWNSGDVTGVFAEVAAGRLGPLFLPTAGFHNIFWATNKTMMRYLPFDENRAKSTPMFGATIIYVAKSQFARTTIRWSVLCALEKNCMGPEGARLPCSGNGWTGYGNCHRFDQSAINLILTCSASTDFYAKKVPVPIAIRRMN